MPPSRALIAQKVQDVPDHAIADRQIVGIADYDEAARVKRNEAARDSGMMPPTVTR
jgi:hypothetical protein